MRKPLLSVALALLLALALGGATLAQTTAPLVVIPKVETAPMPHPRDAADDAAIWKDKAHPSRSTAIATDKKGGIAVYDLKGAQVQYLRGGKPAGYWNNVDIRDGFSLGRERVALVVGSASKHKGLSLGIWKVNRATGKLMSVSAGLSTTLDNNYGLCMYHRRSTGKFYVFINSQYETGQNGGEVEQWELYDNGRGKVSGRKVRTFDVSPSSKMSQTEGCVADDAAEKLYIGEESVGIWRYGANPTDGTTRTKVDSVGGTGHITGDVEGLTLSYGPNGTGYLIAASQGDSTFPVYKRKGANAYVKTFRIGAGKGIDAATHTDGIDVLAEPLGPAFPKGMFVSQDGYNGNAKQNFKLVPYKSIFP
jgi:3-phytase